MSTGVLLLHGFTSHRSSLEPLIPELERRGLDWRLPILAGHGTRPEDLCGKTWADWRQDAERAFNELAQKHEMVVIVALSMGTLLAMELAVKYPDRVNKLVLISPCVVFKNKLSRLTPVIAPIIKKFSFPSKEKFSSPEYTKNDRGYQWFPTATYKSFWQRTKTVFNIVSSIKCPVLIVQSRADRVADPRGAEELDKRILTEHEVKWHTKSGHEMLQDCEAELVISEVVSFLG